MIQIRRAITAPELAQAREVVIRVAECDLGYGYNPQWHWDLDRLTETYVDNPRQAMFVAVSAGTVVATAAVRVGGPNVPPHPEILAERYRDRQSVAQLLRLATLPQWRRQGLGRELIFACHEFVRNDGGFRTLYLHTNTLVPGAEQFWRQMPVVEILDDRGNEGDPRFQTVHFEFPLDARPEVAG